MGSFLLLCLCLFPKKTSSVQTSVKAQMEFQRNWKEAGGKRSAGGRAGHLGSPFREGRNPGVQKDLHGKWKFEKAQQRHKYNVIWSHMFQGAHAKKARDMCKRNYGELLLCPRDQSLLSQGRRFSFVSGPYTVPVFLQVPWFLRSLAPIILYIYMDIYIVFYGSFLLQRGQCEVNTVSIIAIFALLSKPTSKTFSFYFSSP